MFLESAIVVDPSSPSNSSSSHSLIPLNSSNHFTTSSLLTPCVIKQNFESVHSPSPVSPLGQIDI